MCKCVLWDHVRGEDLGIKDLTLVLVLTLIPSPLQLLPVIVQALQAHNAIVKTHPACEDIFW